MVDITLSRDIGGHYTSKRQWSTTIKVKWWTYHYQEPMVKIMYRTLSRANGGHYTTKSQWLTIHYQEPMVDIIHNQDTIVDIIQLRTNGKDYTI